MNSKQLCAAAALVILSGANQSVAQDLEQDFATLLNRCRHSIEMSTEFDSKGMQPYSVSDAHQRNWGIESAQAGWRNPASEMYVVLSHWTAADGQRRHLCDVRLADEERVLDSVEQGLIIRHFLMIKTRLVGAGTHEVDRGLSMVPPLINDAFLLAGRNPDGCRVTTTFALSPDGEFFAAGTGEQAIIQCDENQPIGTW